MTLFPGKSQGGYLRTMLYDTGRGKARVQVRVHRLVAEAFIPNPDNLPHVNHIDCDVTNNRVDNLEWCTPQYNVAYQTKMGRNKFGDRKGKRGTAAKLTPEQVMAIWNEFHHPSRPHAQAIAEKYGVTDEAVYNIVKGKTYRYLNLAAKPTRDCKQCGEPINSKRRDAIFCSPICRTTFHYPRKGDALGEEWGKARKMGDK